MSLLDHVSSQALAWLVHPTLCGEQIPMLWDTGLVNEGLLDLPTDHRPASLSDRGAQMRSHSTWQYFNKPGLAPRSAFSPPRTPNDTLRARLEALFGTLRSQPVYPGTSPAPRPR